MVAAMDKPGLHAELVIHPGLLLEVRGDFPHWVESDGAIRDLRQLKQVLLPVVPGHLIMLDPPRPLQAPSRDPLPMGPPRLRCINPMNQQYDMGRCIGRVSETKNADGQYVVLPWGG